MGLATAGSGNLQGHGEGPLPQPEGEPPPTVVVGRRCPAPYPSLCARSGDLDGDAVGLPDPFLCSCSEHPSKLSSPAAGAIGLVPFQPFLCPGIACGRGLLEPGERLGGLVVLFEKDSQEKHGVTIAAFSKRCHQSYRLGPVAPA